jgi:hypothetical protein
MKHGKSGITRRDFLSGAAYGTLSVALGIGSAHGKGKKAGKAQGFNAAKPVSTVVMIRNKDAVDAGHNINAKVVKSMVDQALVKFSGEKSADKAWKKYFKAEDTVGVKYSRCGWMKVPTSQEILDTIRSGVTSVGVKTGKILENDYGMPVEKCTALVNVSSIKVHTLTGIAGVIKNYINFSGREKEYHHEGSAKLGEIWNLPKVKGKTRLIIVDALRPYFGPGPQINPLHQWDYKGIIVGTDPVAIDTVCLAICQKKRNLFKKEEWLITPPAKSVAKAASEFKLGTDDPSKIKLVRLGWKQDILV